MTRMENKSRRQVSRESVIPLDRTFGRIYAHTMVSVNIRDAERRLSRYVQRVKAGETIVLCEDDEPIAEIRPIANGGDAKRIWFGLFEGAFSVPEDFNDPLPEFERDFYSNTPEQAEQIVFS